ncbi:MAG: hypothetical protein KAX33_12250 [Candidatus Lokiarchaeota archaeon]|nr:hypothetical protein [Candidatus Lokiarchaeota archaeon]
MEQIESTNENTINEFTKLDEKITNIENWVKFVDGEIKTIKNDVKYIREQIKTQEEVINSKFKEFSEEYLIFKKNMTAKLQKVESEYDTMKISLAINEKHLLERLKSMINAEIGTVVKGKEQELLMNLWIDELNEIISDFEKLKSIHPKEFSLRINEISKTIELFKQNLKK